MSSAVGTNTDPPVHEQSGYTAENLVATAFRCSTIFRNAITSQLLAPLYAEIARLQYFIFNLQQDLKAKTDQLYQVQEENRRLQNRLDMCNRDVRRLRRQRDEAEAHISLLIAQSNGLKPLRPPLLGYEGDLTQWSQFIEGIHHRIEDHPQLYKSDRQKCILLLKFMIGPAGKWAGLFLATDCAVVSAPELDNFQVMVAKATLAWGDTGKEAQTREQLMNIRLTIVTVQELFNFHQRFDALATRVSWSEPIVLQCYKQSLPFSLSSRLDEECMAGGINAVQRFVTETVKEMEYRMMG